MRSWGRQALELVTACGFAVAQPVFDVLGRNATFFVAQGANLGAILVLVALLAVALPGVLLLIEWAISLLSRAASRVWHIFVIAGLIAVIFTPPVAKAVDAPTAVWAIAAAGFFVIGIVLQRYHAFTRLLAWMAPSALVFVVLFLFFTGVRDLILPARTTAHPTTARSPTPVVMLLLDEFQLGSLLEPDGQIDASRFPTFAELAEGSTWYPDATTTGESTQWAIPSLLTGRWLEERKTPTARNYPENLFTFVEPSMPIYANEFVSRVCAPTTCERVGADPGLRSMLTDVAVVYAHATLPPSAADRLLPPLTGRWAGFAAPPATADAATKRAQHEFIGWVERDIRDDQLARFDAMLASIQGSRAPALWYIHIGMPHVPWRFLPSLQTYEKERKRLPGLIDEDWTDSRGAVYQGLQRYMMQLGFTDHLLGQLIERMRAQGVYDDALFVVAADHGVSFRPKGNRRLVDEENVEDLVPVPLFVKYPDQRTGVIDRRNAELIDVLPTILDVLGIDPNIDLDGSSLRGPDPKRKTKRLFSGKSGQHVYGTSIPDIAATSQRIRDLFGSAGGPDDLFAFGPHRGLIGTTVRDTAPAHPTAVSVLQKADTFKGVDPKGAYVPAIVQAKLSRALGPERPVAVTLNGRVAGVGWTFAHQGQLIISVMVSPRFLEAGDNDVGIYLIEQNGDLVRLPPGT